MSAATWRCPFCGATNVGQHADCLICHRAVRSFASEPAASPETPYVQTAQTSGYGAQVQQPSYSAPQSYYAQPSQQTVYPSMPAPVQQPLYMVEPVMSAAYPMARPGNGAGTAAGVIGIISAVLMLVPVLNYLSLLLGILAIIFGGVGVSRANRRPGTPKGMAVTGLVLGIISLLVALIFIIGVYAYVFRRTAPWI